MFEHFGHQFGALMLLQYSEVYFSVIALKLSTAFWRFENGFFHINNSLSPVTLNNLFEDAVLEQNTVASAALPPDCDCRRTSPVCELASAS